MTHRFFACTLVAVCLLVGVALGQQTRPPAAPASQQPDRQMPPVTFKVEVNYVEVDARVVDRTGRFVPDLRKDEFQVFEDGKPQKITAFSLVDIPIERAEKPLFATGPIEPDVRTNAQGLDGRIYVLVLDDLHTAPQRSQPVRTAARQFIEQQLGVNDLAAVVMTSGRGDAGQEFTSNRTLLLDAVNKFMGRKLRSATLDMIERAQMQRSGGRGQDPAVTDPEEGERAYNARTVFDDLRRMSDLLAGIRGRRKAVVFISEGVDYNIDDPINNTYADSLRNAAQDAIAAATRANVSIYSVDPRGLATGTEDAIEMAAPPDTTSGLGTTSLAAELRLSQDSLRVISENTGGFAAVNVNDFKSAFDRIARENSSYYVLGYYPGNDKRDGKLRKLEVRVTRPGVEVRARKGYVAPSGKGPSRPPLDSDAIKSAELREALESPVPMSGFKLAAFAAPFKGASSNASVVVVVQAAGQDLKFVEKAGHFDENIEVSLIALGQDGKVKGGDRQTLNMTLKPETWKVVQQVGFRMVSRVDLPPGRYQIRVAGRDSGGSALGSVYYDLVVPDFTREPLTMSGVVLTSRRAGMVPTPRPDEELRKALPGPPTTARLFLPDDELAVLTEIYDNKASQSHKVNITTTIRAEDGRTVFQHADERASSELSGKSGGYGYTVRIPLKALSPGHYVLKVAAQSTLGRDQAVSREVEFGIVGR